MKLKFKMLAIAAAATLAAGAANANFVFGNASSSGNGSVAFVAIANDASISVAIDLNTLMTSFLAQTSLTSGAGALSAAGTTASWNFSTNSYLVNGVAQAGNVSWASPMSSFLASAGAVGGYQWGVIAGENANGAKSATNLVQGQNLLFTASAIDFNTNVDITTGQLNNGTTNVTNFYAALNGTGTNTTTVKGGATSTGGTSFLGTTLAQNNIGDFGGGAFGTNNYLSDVGATTYFGWANSTNPVGVFAIGAGTYANSDATFDPLNAATFTWDGTTLSYSVPAAIPEPGTYAMLLAGLAAIGFIGRRRRNAA